MNCPEVQELLSAYYDGELADDVRLRVLDHLEQCADCAEQLHGFERLSQIANTLSVPAPPERLWSRIATQLDREPDSAPRALQVSDGKPRPSFAARRWTTLAAGILIVATIGLFAYEWFAPHREHAQFSAEFSRYLREFQSDPDAAQHFLLTRYENHRIDPDDSVAHVGYRPAVADGVPPSYTIASTHLMKLPCCTCVQCLCRRADGTSLAIFEHNDAEPEWFAERPSISVTCQSRKCSLVELPDSIAATWKKGERYITVIGARDLSEVNELVAWFDKRKEIVLE